MATKDVLPEENQFEGSHQIADERMVHFLALEAAELVDERVRRREERRGKVLAIALAIISLVGLSGVFAFLQTSLAEDLQQEINRLNTNLDSRMEKFENRVTSRLNTQDEKFERQVDFFVESVTDYSELQEERMKAVVPQLEGELRENATDVVDQRIASLVERQRQAEIDLDLQKLATLSALIELKDRFSPAERDNAVILLKEVGESRHSSEQFLLVLEKVIDSFHAAGLKADVDELEHTFRSSIRNSPGIVFTLLDHYGQRLVSSPSSDEGTLNHRFDLYGQLAGRFNLEHLHLFWKALDDFADGGYERHEASNLAMRQLLYVSEEAQADFLARLFQYCNPLSWVRTVDFTATTLAEATHLFSSVYSTEIEEIMSEVSQEQRFLLQKPHLENLAAAMEAGRLQSISCDWLLPEELMSPEVFLLSSGQR